ncbi:plasmid pRiA4b ORF-3 family protein [Flavobacteriaceae bacterium]|nr:plasmid pRiA4b ORF-3 family protein [Flavobacteriaceae bacterium]
MVYKIRVVLDTKQDVIRTLLVDASSTLEDLHKLIANVFGFNGNEMASFYRADDEWEQGEEIPLFSMDDSPNALCMSNTTIDKNIEDVGEKLIYVYDFFNMWTFYCELVGTINFTNEPLPKLVLTIGDIPEEAPEKEFKADRAGKDEFDMDAFNDEFGDSQDQFESLDNIDFDKY